MRVIAIFAVIVIHTAPYYYWTEKGNLEISLYYFLNGTARFAIPYFFIISGYFFIGSVKRRGVGPALSGFLSRIMLLYVVWGAVFAFLPRVKDLKKFGYWDAVWRKSIGAFQEAPLDFIFSSPGTHLWFLAALALSAALGAAFIAHKRLGGLLVFTGLLYAVGLLGGLYRDSPIGLSLFMDAKLGPFGGPFIFALGVWCGQRGLGAGKGRYDIPLIIIGWAMILIEMLSMRLLYGTPQADFYLGSIVIALGLLRFVVHRPEWGATTPLADWAAFTLGVYVLHTAILRIPRLLEVSPQWPLWEFAEPFVIYGVTLSLCMLLARVKFLRPLVR
jgi:surface polysaccharide O-acyltransferase-like enzyme